MKSYPRHAELHITMPEIELKREENMMVLHNELTALVGKAQTAAFGRSLLAKGLTYEQQCFLYCTEIELTEQDKAAMEAAWLSYQKIDPRKQLSPPPSEGGIREHFYRAGLAAGIERAAVELDNTNPMLRPSGCAVVIRALLKQPSS